MKSNVARLTRERSMTNTSPLLKVAIALLCLCGNLARLAAHEPAAAAAPSADADEKAQEASDAEKKSLDMARRHVSQLKMRVLAGDGETAAAVERPLLAYGDPARTTSHGTLWAFGAKGRPDAFLELWQGTDTQHFWYQSVILSGDRGVVMDLPQGPKWQPPPGKIARTLIDDVDPPSSSASARLRQLKSLAKRFTAYEIGDPGRARFELRLLVQPVHRYEDNERGLRDGAAFVFAHGTNPEVILLIEASGKTAAEPRWRFSAFPSSSAELHVELDGKEVWLRPGAPGVVGAPTDDYWLFSLPTEVVSEDVSPTKAR